MLYRLQLSYKDLKTPVKVKCAIIEEKVTSSGSLSCILLFIGLFESAGVIQIAKCHSCTLIVHF